MGKPDQYGYHLRRGGKKLVEGHDPDWILQERLARRYGYRGPWDQQLLEDLNHPVRRPVLIASLTEIPDAQRQSLEIMLNDFPDFLLRALDILGTKIIYALGYKTDGIYNILRNKNNTEELPKERRKVKHMFILDDGTMVKVV